jgi:transposase-like protein
LCKPCKRSFVTTNTVMFHTQCSSEQWLVSVYDAIQYVSLEKTAKRLDINHATAFCMRHKIISAIESDILKANRLL